MLRAPAPGDADDLLAAFSVGEVIRWLTDIPWPFAATHAQDWLSRCQRNWELANAYPFFAFADTTFVGAVTLTVVNIDEAIVSFWLARDAWGQGFGREMVAAIGSWAFNEKPFKRLVAGVHPDNARSIKLLEALGYMSIGERMYILPPHDHRAVGPHYMLTIDQWQMTRLADRS
ncbi:MAG: GNAT family N-acetyltransferase [Pseudomonadota bacterium]